VTAEGETNVGRPDRNARALQTWDTVLVRHYERTNECHNSLFLGY
jgi:hypothetical protein